MFSCTALCFLQKYRKIFLLFRHILNPAEHLLKLPYLSACLYACDIWKMAEMITITFYVGMFYCNLPTCFQLWLRLDQSNRHFYMKM
jgi:hypothetical protein